MSNRVGKLALAAVAAPLIGLEGLAKAPIGDHFDT